MAKASNNEFPSVLFTDGTADPSAPSASTVRLYFKNDTPYWINSGGTAVAVNAADLSASNLSDLSDVGTATPTDGQVLTYATATSTWEPAAAAGGGGTFAPTDLTGLQIWYDADAEAYSNGSAVGTVTDQSANGYNATQTTGADQPTYTASAVNGKAAYTFASGDHLDITDSITVGTIIFFGTPPAQGAAGVIWGGTQYFGIPSGDTTNFYFNGDAADDAFLGSTSDYCILTGRVDNAAAGSSGIWRNYTAATLGTDSGQSAAVESTSVVGNRAAANSPYVGDICELIIYNRALSVAELRDVWDYLSTKYNL